MGRSMAAEVRIWGLKERAGLRGACIYWPMAVPASSEQVPAPGFGWLARAEPSLPKPCICFRARGSARGTA
jgi:hypothetical protein